MQLLLSDAPYRDLMVPWPPMYAADWDAVDMLPVFFQFFIYKPKLLWALASENEVNKVLFLFSFS